MSRTLPQKRRNPYAYGSNYAYRMRGYQVYDSSEAPHIPIYQMMPRGGRYTPQSKRYRLGQAPRFVPRTPGGQIVSERKYFDTQGSSAVNITNASFNGAEVDPTTVNCLCAPSQGNDISNREGRNIFVYNITVRGTLKVNAQSAQNSGDRGQTVRLILVMDKQTNGTQMASEDLIASAVSVPMTFGFQNTANFGRFQILKDKFIPMGPFPISSNGSVLIQGGVTKMFKLKYSFKSPIKVNFNSTNGGTVADIVDNSFHILAGRDDPDTPVELTYKARVAFTG